MKKLMLMAFMMIGVLAAYGQDSEIPLGEYSGTGDIFGKRMTINLKVILGNLMVQKSGAVNCMTLLRSSETAGLYEEIDQYDNTGKVAKDSCKEKGFVYLEKTADGVIYAWSMDKLDVLGKNSAITLKKKGAKTVKGTASSGGTVKTVKTVKTKTVSSNKKSALGNLLLELESNVKWEAVEDKWKDERDAWTADAAKATTVAAVGGLLLRLESNAKWESVGDGWAKRRDAWVAEVGKATTAAKLAALLAEFEATLKWEAVEDAWKTRRAAWSSEVKKAKN